MFLPTSHKIQFLTVFFVCLFFLRRKGYAKAKVLRAYDSHYWSLQPRGEERGRHTWIAIRPLLLTSCVSLRKSPNLSEPVP